MQNGNHLIVGDMALSRWESSIGTTKFEQRKRRVIKISFNDCQPKTIGFLVSTSNLDHLHG